MKHIQPFVLFESKAVRLSSGLTSEQEDFLDEWSGGTWIVNPTTGLVDVQGDFDCSNQSLKSLMGISFGHVNGEFNCYHNKLTSLEGAPQTVDGNFHCSNNQLTSLEGAPQTVGGNFFCDRNKLTSLKGSPQTVGVGFDCYRNELRSLVGAPQTVNGDFYCQENDLTSLEGAPQMVGEDFWCQENDLTSLEGAPQTVGGDLYCYLNQLTSLAGAPRTVGRDFYCDLFELEVGKWNTEGWLEVLKTGTPQAKKLILTLPAFNAEYWNNKLKEEPKATTLQMVSFWNDLPKEIQDGIQIPPNMKDGFESLLDLQRAGIF